MSKTLSIVSILLLSTTLLLAVPSAGPFLATGIKIGEVDQSSAIIWGRLTQNNQRIGDEAPLPEILYRNSETGNYESRRGSSRSSRTPKVVFPGGADIRSIEGATPGVQGRIRLQYRKSGTTPWQKLDWKKVDPEKDFTHQFKIKGLTPGTSYEINVQAASLWDDTVTASLAGSFKTAPDKSSEVPVNFIVTTGTSYPDKDTPAGYQFYLSALKRDPEFFVHTGDILYYDGYAKTRELALWHWDRMYSLPNHIRFHRQVASYFIKDDHDTWFNDCYPQQETKFMGTFTFSQGQDLFLHEVPMGDKTYRTVRWGKDLQIWMVEGRDFRSPNTMPDGPDKTIWGKEQMEWFKSTVKESNATFRVLISPTPIVGPDREKKNDNHANSGFAYEGARIRKFIQSQPNMVVVCGDRHWQYISKDPLTGVLEFSCGPGSDAHAGGWKKEDVRPKHLYLNVCGGFLEGEVHREEGTPMLTFRHFTPSGTLLHAYTLKATP